MKARDERVSLMNEVCIMNLLIDLLILRQAVAPNIGSWRYPHAKGM